MGMTIDEVRAILGKEVSTADAGSGVTLYRFGSPQTFNVYIERGKLTDVYTFLPDYKTAEGIGVGSSFAEMVAAYGSPKGQKAVAAMINGRAYDALYLDYSNVGLIAFLDRAAQKIIIFGI